MKWSERKLERSTFFKADFMLFFNDCLIFSIPFRICSCGRIVTVKWHFGEHENPLYYVLYSSFRCYQGACSHNDSSKNSNLHNKVEFFLNPFYHRNYFGNTFDIFNIYTEQYGFCSATSSAFPATWPGWCCCRRSTSPAPASTTGSRRRCSAGCCPWWPAGAGPPATT